MSQHLSFSFQGKTLGVITFIIVIVRTGTREIRPSGIAGGHAETWMRIISLRAPHFYPDKNRGEKDAGIQSCRVAMVAVATIEEGLRLKKCESFAACLPVGRVVNRQL